MTKPRLSIIGTGNLGTQLALAFHEAAYVVVDVCSRSADRAIPLAEQLQARFIDNVLMLSDDADVYLFCISEEDLRILPALPQLNGKLVCHSSGSTAMDIFGDLSSRLGVFYPLQTFSLSEHIDFKGIPILIETSLEEDNGMLQFMAQSISGNFSLMKGSDRNVAHLCAVIACNFSNYLYSVAEDLLQQQGISFEILHPIILETARKASRLSPKIGQTGPAARADYEIIKRQEALLKQTPEILKIYDLITHEILQRYHPLKTPTGEL